MLTAYYSRGCDSEAMFSGLEISSAPDFRKHLNQYDVIHLDIQWCINPAGGPEQVIRYITEKTIEELKICYPEEMKEILYAIENHRNKEMLKRNDLAGILYRADKMSRCCFGCRAEKECNWSTEKKNMEIQY